MDGFIGTAQSSDPACTLPAQAEFWQPSVITRPLVFLHIPKTAGTSLIELLARNFDAGDVCRITDIHRTLSEITADVEVAVAEGKRLICGHFPYAAIAPLRHEVTPFTVLRHPIDRIVSLYKFWRVQDPDRAGGPAARFACALARNLDFDRFLASDHPLIVSATRDEMCKSLAAPNTANTIADRLGSASANLAAMSFGLVEDMPRTLRLLSQRLRINLLDDVRLNTTQHLPELSLSCAQREFLMRLNIGDIALYDDATTRFSAAIRRSEIETTYRDIGARALCPMQPDDRGNFHWDAASPVSGTGWNDRETLADGSCYRFSSSPETIAYLPNHLPGRPFTLRVNVAFFNRDALIDRTGEVDPHHALSFTLDDTPLEAHTTCSQTTGVTYDIAIPAPGRHEPILQLALRSRYGIAPSVFGSPDTRNLLAAVRSISLVR